MTIEKMKRVDTFSRIDIYNLDSQVKKEFQHEVKKRGVTAPVLFAEMWAIYKKIENRI